jgi:beta-lactamase regulating signal transducer with metallopeptidase domain
MMPAMELHAIAQYSALRLLDSLAEGVLVGLFTAVLLRASRRQTAGTKFAILFSALVAIAVLPLTSGVWPSSGVSLAISSGARFVVPESWAVYLFAAWAVAAAWSVARVGRALCHLHRVRKSCVAVDLATLDPLLRETLQRKLSSRKILLCTSEQVRVPTAIGLVRPAIVIPHWAMQELSVAELNQVVLHELAHLRRWDDWTNLAQQMVRALLFFHPAVWWIEKKVALEREMACDESVLAETGSPRAYAECLAHLAEKSLVHRGMALAQAVLGRVSQISQRVSKILSVKRPQGKAQGWKPAVTLVAGFAIVCSVVVEKSPKLIAFRADPPVRLADLRPQTSEFRPQTADLRPQTSDLGLSSVPQAVPKVSVAKFTEKPRQRRVGIHSQRAALRASLKAPAISPAPATPNSLVHLTGFEPAPAAITEAVFVVVERSGENRDRQLYQIQVWRVMVLQQVVNQVSNKTPRKET